MIPSANVGEFARSHAWNPETAAMKLAPLLGDAWFWKVLSPRLTFKSLSEDEALAVLADAASATPDRKDQLRIILEFLESARLITREGGRVKKVEGTPEILGSDGLVAGPSAQIDPAPAAPPPSPLAMVSAPAPISREQLAAALLEILDVRTPESVQDALWQVIRYLRGAIQVGAADQKGGDRSDQKKTGNGG